MPVFCFERALVSGRHASPNRNAYLLGCLRELDRDLRAAGSRLHYRHGDPARQLRALADRVGALEVHASRDHTPRARAGERRVAAALDEIGCALVLHDGVTAAGIGAIETGSGGPYKVFSPFATAWEKAPRRPLEARPTQLSSPEAEGGRLPSEAELGIDATAKRIAAVAEPGEAGGRTAMERAVENAADYERVRDLPGADATTRLSAPLHFGTVSARELESLLAEKRSRGAAALRRQIAWRDFWLNVIGAFPDNRELEFDERMRRIRWRDEPESLEAWKRGETGVPWIDAGMRQLLAEGWMHNRLRMAVASYLTKNLLIDWREGEAHFMRHLIDGDTAQNNGNWQWAASVGADAQPYFRVFNPARQQQRFDSEGVYVRRWVPEVAGFADKRLAEPWKASADEQQAAGCVIGRDYPEPLVDLGESRAEAIARFEDARDGV